MTENPSIAAQQYESTSLSLNPGHWTKTGTTNRLLQKSQTKWLKHDSCNDTGCNEQWPMHDTLQPNTRRGATHNHMVTIKIWIDDRISRVTWVSSVRQLQIWLKNFYRWSRKWSRCEENDRGVKKMNKVWRTTLSRDQYSIYNKTSLIQPSTRAL